MDCNYGVMADEKTDIDLIILHLIYIIMKILLKIIDIIIGTNNF